MQMTVHSNYNSYRLWIDYLDFEFDVKGLQVTQKSIQKAQSSRL